MKTIKELEQEIEEVRNNLKGIDLDKLDTFELIKLNSYIEIIIQEATLTQTIAIKEMIKKVQEKFVKKNNIECWELEEVLAKIRGGGE